MAKAKFRKRTALNRNPVAGSLRGIRRGHMIIQSKRNRTLDRLARKEAYDG